MRHPIPSLVMLALAAAAGGCRPAAPPAKTSDAAAGAPQEPTDRLLLAAAKVALPPSGVTANDLPDPTSAGAQLAVRYCAQCHGLPAPAAHSATDWPGVARRMWLRMEWLPADLGVQVPTAADRYTILNYYLANALKVSPAVLPPGRGREEFSAICSRCHALPDPRIHSPQDWPTVFQRMERNMDRMKVSTPTPAEGTDILLYLESTSGKPRPAGN